MTGFYFERHKLPIHYMYQMTRRLNTHHMPCHEKIYLIYMQTIEDLIGFSSAQAFDLE